MKKRLLIILVLGVVFAPSALAVESGVLKTGETTDLAGTAAHCKYAPLAQKLTPEEQQFLADKINAAKSQAGN